MRANTLTRIVRAAQGAGLAATLALLVAACSNAQTPATAAKPGAGASSANGAQSTGPANPEIAATPDQSATAPGGSDATVSIKAVDETTGKVVDLELQNVFFDLDKYEIKPEYVPVVAHDAQVLNTLPHLKVVVEGHCDERGTTEYNLALGQRRAVAVLQALQSHAVAKARMSAISYGKERPADPGHDESAWAKNRRGAFRRA